MCNVYNDVMQRIKIFITILVLYEFVLMTILQIPDYCVSVFNYNFCETNSFKYFLLCLMLPISVGLFIWWMPEIARLLCPNRCNMKIEEKESAKNMFDKIISKQDLERFITTAIIMGIQKFVASHPKAKEVIDDVGDILQGVNKENQQNKKRKK